MLMLLLLSFQTNAQESLASSPEVYSRVKVKTTPQQFAKMNEAIGFDHVHLQPDGSFIGEFSQSEIAKMTALGVKVKVLVPDIVKDLVQKNSSASRLKTQSISADLTLPTGFTYGSMAGYLTFAEIVAKLDSLRSMYPSLISAKWSIGKSTEGRDLWVVKISDNPDIDENEPKVFYNSLTHAREPMGMMQMFYYMCYILQNYNTDPEIKHLVDNRELYFEPCVNPDGYEYNRSTNPSGGGMWRKNRYKVYTTKISVSNCKSTTTKVCDTTWKTTKTYTTSNCSTLTYYACDTTWNNTHTKYTVKNCKNRTKTICDTTWKYTTTFTTNNCHNVTKTICDTTKTTTATTYGVDLNRNYAYKWGVDNTGSSNSQTSDTYRGPSAFSEPEVAAIRDFSILKQFKDVSNQHTYGNDATYPFSYQDGVVIPDQALYMLKNKLITESNNFLIGHMLQTCGYLANGEASDWQYGEQTTKPKAYSWSPELGTSTDGFWPPQSRIEPLCLTMVRMNTNIAWIAGEYYRCSAPANLNATTASLTVPVSIINYGDATGTVETIKFIANNNVATGSDSVSLSGIVPGMTASRNLTLDLSGLSGSGALSGVLRLTYPDGYTQDTPLNFTYALPSALTGSETQRTKAPAADLSGSYQLYPNPVNDVLYFTSGSNETPVSISVYNLNGEMVRKVMNETQVSLYDLPAGMYQVMIETANGILNNKIVKH